MLVRCTLRRKELVNPHDRRNGFSSRLPHNCNTTASQLPHNHGSALNTHIAHIAHIGDYTRPPPQLTCFGLLLNSAFRRPLSAGMM